jgi:hypothetical protein
MFATFPGRELGRHAEQSCGYLLDDFCAVEFSTFDTAAPAVSSSELEAAQDRLMSEFSDQPPNRQLPQQDFHSLIVRTTDAVGRSLTVGSLMSLASISSYCSSVFTGSFAFIWTIL